MDFLAKCFGGKKERAACRNGPNCSYLKMGRCNFSHSTNGKGFNKPVTKEKYVKDSLYKLESLVETLTLKVGILEAFVFEMSQLPMFAESMDGAGKWTYL